MTITDYYPKPSDEEARRAIENAGSWIEADLDELVGEDYFRVKGYVLEQQGRIETLKNALKMLVDSGGTVGWGEAKKALEDEAQKALEHK